MTTPRTTTTTRTTLDDLRDNNKNVFFLASERIFFCNHILFQDIVATTFPKTTHTTPVHTQTHTTTMMMMMTTTWVSFSLHIYITPILFSIQGQDTTHKTCLCLPSREKTVCSRIGESLEVSTGMNGRLLLFLSQTEKEIVSCSGRERTYKINKHTPL